MGVRTWKIFLGVCACVFAWVCVSGCAKIVHLDQLLTIKAYSDNEDEKKQFIQASDKRFETLFHDLTAGRLAPATPREDVRKAYGRPVYERELGDGAEAGTLWMYRRQTDYSGGEKLYLYFDAQGGLLRWEQEGPCAERDKLSKRSRSLSPPGLSVRKQGESVYGPVFEKASPEKIG